MPGHLKVEITSKAKLIKTVFYGILKMFGLIYFLQGMGLYQINIKFRPMHICFLNAMSASDHRIRAAASVLDFIL